jgi:hypothetical protein
MDQTAAADPGRRRDPAAPSELDAAADNVGRVRPRRDVEQQPGEDEQPEFMNAERRCHLWSGSIVACLGLICAHAIY